MEEGSQGFEVGRRTSETVNIPDGGGGGGAAALSGPSSAYVTPRNKQGLSSSPYTESPTSFHTADQLDNEYQQDVLSEVIESAASTPPNAHRHFYSDGRPRPIHDGDIDSLDSLEGYATATQIPASRFMDPDQPKLLLAEEEGSVQPHSEKRPLTDEYTHSPTTGQQTLQEEHHHRGVDQQHQGGSKRSRGRGQADEQTPLLRGERGGDPSRVEDEDRGSGCCIIL